MADLSPMPPPFVRRAYDATDPKAKLKDIYKFTQEHQVEMLARCCRQWVDEDTLDEDAVRLAELVIKVWPLHCSRSLACCHNHVDSSS
jgi:hypothetical protein